MEKLEVLKRSEMFRELNDDQLKVVEKMGSYQEYEPGAVICRQGECEERVYVVEDGLVGIVLEVGPLAQRQVQTATNFETFGWSGMIEPYVYTATVKALEKTRALAFNGRELCNLCDTNPNIACVICRSVARLVASRLRAAYIQLLGVTYQE